MFFVTFNPSRYLPEKGMSFREKTAWVTLSAIIAVSLMYWFHVPHLFEPHPGHWVLPAMGVSLAAYVLIEIVAYIVLRLRNPTDARTPKDERERLIDLKSMRVAYYVFTLGALGGMFVTLHVVDAGPVAVGMVVFLAFVLSQIVKYATRIVYHRRDA
jgi:small-conductance mechanosensitive channel